MLNAQPQVLLLAILVLDLAEEGKANARECVRERECKKAEQGSRSVSVLHRLVAARKAPDEVSSTVHADAPEVLQSVGWGNGPI
jgi:hypothetical protein